jgi:hypothetical protein
MKNVPTNPSLLYSITKIQAVYKSYQTRKYLNYLHLNATKIQTIYRGYKVRKSTQTLLKLSKSSNQLSLQMNQTQDKIKNLEKEMQELSIANTSRVRLWESEKREKAARCIQKWLRRFLIRKNISSVGSPLQNKVNETTVTHPIKSLSALQQMPLMWQDDIEEDLCVRETIEKIVKRIHRDQLKQLSIYKDDKRYQFDKQSDHKNRQVAPDSLVAKLKTLSQILDEYYGTQNRNEKQQCSSLSTFNSLKESIQLRSEIEILMAYIQSGK